MPGMEGGFKDGGEILEWSAMSENDYVGCGGRRTRNSKSLQLLGWAALGFGVAMGAGRLIAAEHNRLIFKP
jgi:hypothetical protein